MKDEIEGSSPEGHTRVQWAVAALISTTVFTYGLQTGWVSPMSKILQSVSSPVGRPITSTEISLIAGVPSLSAMASIVIFSHLVDKYGRKIIILIMATFQLVSWIIIICPATVNSIIAARIIAGFGAGGCFHVVPMYIKELSQDNIRGTLGAMFMMCSNLGVLTMYILGGYLNYYTILYIVLAVPVFTIVMVFKIPESPAFLVKQKKIEAAASTIAYLRGLDTDNKQVQAEIVSVQKEDEFFNSIPNISFIKIFKETAWRRGFLVMCVIMSTHAMNGAFSIVNYASILLADSEINISPELQSLSIPVFLILGTLIPMSSVDKVGRRVLLGVTFMLSALLFTGLGVTMLLRDQGWSTPGWIPVVALLLIVGTFGAGVCPVPYIILAEMFNFQVRAKLMGCLSFLAWFLSFTQLLSFTAITGAFGAYTAFFVFGCINICGAVAVLLILPETGGKSIEQIEEALGKKKTKEDKGCS